MDLSNPTITVVCEQCENKLTFKLDVPATFACQQCGCSSGYLYSFNIKENGLVNFTCNGCKNEFFINKGTPCLLACPKCGGRVITPSSEIVFSKVTKFYTHFDKPQPKESLLKGELPVPHSLKIVIPYYNGGERIDRSVMTWIIPEVVWAITDETTIPPGWGICSQIFTPKNTKSEGLHETKTKPFLLDILRRLMEKFPNEEYYGFFNTDIILPPGVPVNLLLPSKGKKIVFYHRKDLVGGKSDTPIRKYNKGNQAICGKDGFIADRETMKYIVDNMLETVVGAPVWDDGLVMWSWKKFGKNKVELRYGDIWHLLHPLEWSVYETDAQYNAKQVELSGVPRQEWYEVKWDKEQHEAELERQKLPQKKVLGIIQPGRIGDIIIVLPIAKWFYEIGYKVIWPVCGEYLPLFDDYINYVEPVEIEGGLGMSYVGSLRVMSEARVDRVVDLGIGFGRHEEDWISSGLRFNEWKYKAAEVPQEERFNLQVVRNFKKESALWEKIKASYKFNGEGFSVIHDLGTKGNYKFEKEGVRITPEQGFTVWDWIGVIEKANYLYCVDSCIANLADQLKLCVGKRTVWFWEGIPDREPRKTLGFPKLCDDWVKIGRSE